jgi:hypothetical protein
MLGLSAVAPTPKRREPRGRQLRVPDGMLNVGMTEPRLNGPRVVTSIGERISTAVAQHVGVDRERKLRASADALDLPVDRVRCELAAAFRTTRRLVEFLGGPLRKATERYYPCLIRAGPRCRIISHLQSLGVPFRFFTVTLCLKAACKIWNFQT